MKDSGWITEPGWRYTTFPRFVAHHVCEENQFPVLAEVQGDGSVICPRCGEELNLERVEP